MTEDRNTPSEGEILRTITHRVTLVEPDAETDLDLDEVSRFVIGPDGEAEQLSTRLCTTLNLEGAPPRAIEVEEDELSEALLSLERLLPEGTYLRICHQCRFGVTHPLQGEEWWCLKHDPPLADAIQASGKQSPVPFRGMQIIQVGETQTCPHFQRPRTPYRSVPGAPRRL